VKASGWIVAALAAAVALTALRCGREEKKKKDDPAPTLPAPGPSPSTVIDVKVPTDWDGTADWSGNALEVIEE